MFTDFQALVQLRMTERGIELASLVPRQFFFAQLTLHLGMDFVVGNIEVIKEQLITTINRRELTELSIFSRIQSLLFPVLR